MTCDWHIYQILSCFQPIKLSILWALNTTIYFSWVCKCQERQTKRENISTLFHSLMNFLFTYIPQKLIYRQFPFLCNYTNSLLLTTHLQRQEGCHIINLCCALNLFKYTFASYKQNWVNITKSNAPRSLALSVTIKECFSLI